MFRECIQPCSKAGFFVTEKNGGIMDTPLGVLAHLPSELEYLVEAALKYGVHQDDVERGEFLKRMNDEQIEDLARVAERYRLSEHHDLVGSFFDKYPITAYPESAKLYWLFGFMNEAGLRLSPEDWNTVDRHIESLSKFGSFRLASERAHAARFLSEFGEKARPAIPFLRRALVDEDLRVRVWAHFALAMIDGNRPEHEQAIREIYSKHGRRDKAGDHVEDVGSDANAALELFRDMGTSV